MDKCKHFIIPNVPCALPVGCGWFQKREKSIFGHATLNLNFVSTELSISRKFGDLLGVKVCFVLSENNKNQFIFLKIKTNLF